MGSEIVSDNSKNIYKCVFFSAFFILFLSDRLTNKNKYPQRNYEDVGNAFAKREKEDLKYDLLVHFSYLIMLHIFIEWKEISEAFAVIMRGGYIGIVAAGIVIGPFPGITILPWAQ